MAAPIRKLKMARTIVTIRKFCAFVSHSIPTQQIRMSTSTVIDPTIRMSLIPLSTIFRSLFSGNEINDYSGTKLRISSNLIKPDWIHEI